VAAVVAVYLGLAHPIFGTPTNEASTGRWLAAGGKPGDSVVVVYGQANVVFYSGMTTPYPFLWSLQTRTLDPHLDEMVGELSGPDAPTWVVQWTDPDTWGLDADGRLAGVIARRYVEVGRPCGAEVFLRRGVSRDVVPDSVCKSH
jgi:hypothetical protein